MIKINLLPEEFRIQETRRDYGQYIKIAVAAFVFFILLTIFFYVDFILSSARLGKVEKKWSELQPQFNELNLLQKEVDGAMKQEREFMQQFVTTERPLTTVLEWTSELLPQTAWLIEIKVTQEKGVVNFLLKGLCLPAKGKTSIEQIDQYLQDLKKKMPDVRLSLQTTRNQIGEIEMTQFTSNFQWGKVAQPPS